MNQDNRKLAFEYALTKMPKEACGLVVVQKGREIFIPCENMATINSQFEISPSDWAMAEDRGEIVEVFHSHVLTPPQASDADRVSCEATDLPWSIVSVPTGAWYEFEPSNFKAPLVGRQWAYGVLDCYSIVRDYYQEVLGISLNNYHRDFEFWLKGQSLYMDNYAKEGFEIVTDGSLEKHDVLLMQVASPVENHAAVYLGDDLILHHLQNRLSSRDVYGGYFKKHTTKVMRYARD